MSLESTSKVTYPPIRRGPRYPELNRNSVATASVSTSTPANFGVPSLVAPPLMTPQRPRLFTGTVSRPITALQRIGFAALVFYVVVMYSRLVELIAMGGGVALPGGWISLGVAVVGLLLCGTEGLRNLNSTIGRLLLVYTFWLALTIPLATWRGGAFAVYKGQWLPSLLTFILLGGMVLSFEYLRKLIFWMVAAVAIILAACAFFGTEIDGRFGLLRGTLQNANDFAMHLLMIAPLCLFLARDPASSIFKRVFGVVSGALIILISLRTASRTGLLALLVYAVAILFTASFVNKLKLIVLTVIFGLGFVVTLPRHVLVRYATMVTDSGSTPGESDSTVLSAQESAALRERLFRYSLQMAVSHPLFGVGLGNFAWTAQEESSKTTESTSWKQPHNVYNQIAAEAGIPGVALYIAILWAAFRACFRARKASQGIPSQQSRHLLANCLLLTLLGYAVTNFFATSAYGPYLPLFVGLALLLDRLGEGAPARSVPRPAAGQLRPGYATR